MRVRAFPLRFSASAPGCDLHRHPPPPNNSFKPTPCRGIGHVLYATLAHVRRPATGRLNSSVRRQKSIRFPPPLFRSVQPFHSLLRLCLSQLLRYFFRQSCIASERLRGALTLRIRYACRLRKQRALSVSFPTPDPLLRRQPVDSSRGALKHLGSGFRQVRQGPICIGIPRHLTIRSSRPHIVASATCIRYASTRPPPRCGAA